MSSLSATCAHREAGRRLARCALVCQRVTKTVELFPIDVDVADAFVGIDRVLVADPWDRLIVATALALGVPLVTRDEAIRACGLVEIIW